MMANITMAKKRSSPICSKGTMAFMMDLRTTCRPEGGDTKTPQGGKENKDMGMERRWERRGNLGLAIPSNAALPRVPQTHFLP